MTNNYTHERCINIDRNQSKRRLSLWQLALLCFVAMMISATSAMASVTITAATGGSAVSADTTGGTYTTLTGPIFTESALGQIGSGTIILTAPSGFVFNAGVTVTVTVTGDTGNQNKNINHVASGSTFNASVTTSAITLTINQLSTSQGNVLKLNNIQVRPSAGTPLASGAIVQSGTSTFTGGSTGSPGTLTEVAGASTKLAFGQAPTSAQVNSTISPAITVLVQDQFGNTTTSTASITNAIGTNPGSGTLSGTKIVSAVSGTATFSTLSIDKIANGYTLTATSSPLTSATSTTFNITKGSSSTSVASSANPSVSGQSVTFTATVSAVAPATGTPSGTVVFKDGATALSTNTLSSGSAAFSTSSLVVATHAITAEYSGDSNFLTSTNTALSQVVNKGGTTMAVSSGTNPSLSGQSVTFTATVSVTSPAIGTATGTVTFKDGATSLGSRALSGGQATLTTSSLSATSHPITVEYTGDSSLSGSTNSPALSQTVNKADTTTALTSSANPSVFGQSVTFTATVAAVAPGAGTPSGTVTFKDGATTLGTGNLNGSGVATFATGALSVATHSSITASYGGDSSFNTSDSSAVPQVVNADNTTTAVTSSANPSVSGQSVTFTATVTANAPGSGTPTGTVTFKDGGSSIGSGTLNGSGQATLTTSSLNVASHSITVDYATDGNYNSSSSSILTQVVNTDSTTTMVSSSANPSVAGQSVTFTATVTANAPGSGTPTGTVTFKDGATTLGTGALSGGTATLSTSALSTASHSITAVYGADSNFDTSASLVLSQTVNKADTTTSLNSSVNPSTYQQSVTFTATVAVTSPGNGAASGTVTFKDGATTLGTGSLSGGTATFSTSALSVASHSITAVYGGDGDFNTSTSSAVAQTVNTTTPVPTVSSAVNPSIVNQSVSFSVTVPTVSGGVAPTGTVQFKIDGSAFGSAVTLSSGTASSGVIATLAQGDHTVTAEYSGDGNYAAATGALTQTVTAPLATCTASNNGPTCAGGTIQLFGTTTDTGSGVYYSWTGPNGFTSTNQNPTISNVSAADAGAYWLTTGTSGTTNCIESTVVSIAPALTASVSADTVCTGTSGNISANVSGGTAPYIYAWSPGGATTQTISVTDGGLYTVTVTDSTGATHCSVQASGALTLKALPVVAVSGANTVCPNSTNTFSAPAGMSSYAWLVSGAATIDGAANAQTVNVVAAPGCNTNFSLSLSVVSNGCANGTSANVSVIDTTAPTITSIPADATVSCANAVSAANDAAVVATDDCSSITISHLSDSVTSSNCPNNFTITRTYVATDACGNSSSQSQTITVHDTTGPVITGFPADATVACSSAVPSVDDGAVTATDACGGSVVVTHNDDVVTAGSCANRFSIARTYIATDACGNSSSQTQTITVDDNVAPVLAGVPADATVQCNAVPAAATPTASDNCDSNPSVSFDESTAAGACAGSYTITRTWTATDSCGNSSSGTQTITVVDTIAPVLVGVPADATKQCDNVGAPAFVTATDNCDSTPNVGFAESSVAGSCAGSYVLTRTWTATDACGNTSSASQHVTVVDTTAPVLGSVPADATVQCDSIPTAASPGAADGCDAHPTVSLSETKTDGACANSYTLTRVWTAIDVCGNSSSKTQVLTVIDTTAPVIVGVPADATVQCDAVPAAATATATDSCDTNPAISFAQTSAAGACANSYVLTRVWTATDACGNSSTASQTITVIDTTAPVIAGVPADATVQCNAVPAAATPTATDSCDSHPSISFNETSAAGACANSYVLTRVWTATDACGNSSSATQVVTVIDTAAPVLAGVPSDATVQCSAVPAAATPTATDSCDNNPSISFAETSAAGSCAGSYLLTRTWTATDACGNHSSATQHVTVIDTVAPVLAGVPADVTAQCDSIPTVASPTATDNCDSSPNITYAQTSAAGSCAGSFVLTRTWTTTDACGNSSSASQTITVVDTTAPVLAGVPADTTVQCDTVPTAATPSVMDNCDTNATVSLSEASAPGACVNSSVLTRTWTATDICGNSSSATQTITVIDTTAPVIAGVPADVTVQCDAVPTAATPTATDTCDTNAAISFNETSAAGACANSYVLTRTWTATDACGNTSTASQTITVIDTAAPVIAGVPADATVQCDAVPTAASPTATDTCDTNPSISFNESSAAGACANSYVLTRVWTATDACGNSSSATQTITVIDTAAPVLAGVPSDTTVQCSSIPAAASPTATDTCDNNPAISFAETSAAGSCAGSFVLTRTWTAADACGNQSSASQHITVNDTTAPVLAGVPSDVTAQCDSVPAVASPTATDNCDSAPTIGYNQTSVVASCAGSYVLTRTWTAIDACGNSSSASQTITVIDTTAPVLAGVPVDATVQCDAVPTAATPTATDNCDTNATITFSQTTAAGSCANGYVLTRVWTATDACGNSSSATQLVTVIDTTAPVIAGVPADSTVQCDAVPTAANPTATDTCDSNPAISFNETSAAGSCANSHVLTRTWTATDACGNTSTASQTITVIDTTAPVIAGVPADTTVQCDSVPTAATPTATDNCDATPTVSLNETTANGSVAGQFVITRTWTATDACGNTSTASQHITAFDSIAPVLAGVPASTTVECSSVPAAATPTATDNCDAHPTVGLAESTVAGSCAGSYVLTRTWTATDASGNTSSATQTITVHDTTAPVLAGVPADATVQCDVVPAAATATATDNCDTNATVTMAEVRVNGSCANSYTLTRTWTATDACGNSSTSAQTITVIDTTAPVIAGVPVDATVQCDSVPTAASPTATDSCDSNPSIVFSQSTAAGSCAGNYVITRTWTATDACGNSSVKTQTITVHDTVAPVLAGVPADATVQCSAVPTAATPTATDNCDATPTVSLNETSAAGACAGSYVLTRTWTATDACGNTSTAAQHVTVVDTIAPVLASVPVNTTAQCSSIPAAATPTATDNCDSNPSISFAETSAAGSCAGSYVLTRTWTATDVCGNHSSASQTITVVDTTAPIIVGVPANTTAQCGAVPTAATPTATDNCDSNPQVALSESTAPGSCAGSYVLTRTWTATDVCGNSSSASQTITVTDTTAPVLAGVPASTTVQCGSVPTAATPTATDNCDSNPSITFHESSAAGSCAGSSVLTRTWTVTDVCGNSSSSTQTITVIDTTAPVIAGVPASATVQCSSVPTAASPTATDNCDSNPTVTLSESTVAGSSANNYTLNRTWTATDACGNTSTAQQVLTVVDSTAPVLASVPADATATCNNVPAAGSPTATDNCDANATVTLAETSTQTPSGCTHDSYTIIRTWTATDAAGNTSTAAQTITVTSVAPVITAFPADATYTCASSVPAADDNLVTAGDACGAAVVITHDADVISGQTCANHYTITRTYHATSACGTVVSQSQTITVDDSTAPTITGFPADASYTSTNQIPAANDSLVTATDNCGAGVTITHSPDSTVNVIDAHHFQVQRSYTATDACGNATSQTQTFTINSTASVTVAITGSINVLTNQPSWTFHGTASGENPISAVRYSLNGAAVQTAVGTTSWSAALTLVAGTNTFVVYAVDNQNNQSSVSNAVVFYSTTNKLVVVAQDWPHKANASTAKFTMLNVIGNPNGKKLEVGRSYTITALPGTNRRFLGWANTLDTNVPVFAITTTTTFVFDPTHPLVARFENSFYHIKGNYSGLFSETIVDPRSAGYITISMPEAADASANKFSAHVILQGQKYAVSAKVGSFDTNGHAHFVAGPVIVDLDADLHAGFNGIITGTVSNSTWSANLTAYRTLDKKVDAIPAAARFTMVLPPQDDSPNGYGYGAFNRVSSGNVAVAGTLADGSAWVAQAGKPSPDGHWPLYAQLYKKNANGVLFGWVQFTGDQQGVTGNLTWFRPANLTTAPATPNFPAGIANTNITIIGSPYSASVDSFNWTTNGVVFLYDDHRKGVTNIVAKTLGIVNDLNYPPTNKVVLKLTGTTGLMGTSFLDPNDKKVDHIKGVVLQNQAMAAGLFYRTNAGKFLMHELP